MTGVELYIKLTVAGYEYYAGIPDSTLAPFLVYLESKSVVPANEGAAIAAACGYHLATGKVPVVYMQNSGLTNALNPISSLAIPYDIPFLLLIGMRGINGETAPQHVADGKATEKLLDTYDIKYIYASDDMDIRAISGKRKAILFPPEYLKGDTRKLTMPYGLPRKETILYLTKHIDPACKIISTTGYISRELYKARETLKQSHDNDFYCVGAMGHASMIANEIARHTNKMVYVFDGDGSVFMHMGALAHIGQCKPNLTHIVFNNGCYDSVGAMKTANINICKIAKACGYKTIKIKRYKDLNKAIKHTNGLRLFEIITCPDQIKAPRIDNVIHLKEKFMENI